LFEEAKKKKAPKPYRVYTWHGTGLLVYDPSAQLRPGECVYLFGVNSQRMRRFEPQQVHREMALVNNPEMREAATTAYEQWREDGHYLAFLAEEKNRPESENEET